MDEASGRSTPSCAIIATTGIAPSMIRPSGGGAGMVLKPDILAAAIDAVAPAGDPRPRMLMSPRGKPLTQARVRELAAGPGRGDRLRAVRGHRPARHRARAVSRKSRSATMCWPAAKSPPWCCSKPWCG